MISEILKNDQRLCDMEAEVKVLNAEFLITLEAWAKLAQPWLVCALHFEPINKELMLLVTI